MQLLKQNQYTCTSMRNITVAVIMCTYMKVVLENKPKKLGIRLLLNVLPTLKNQDCLERNKKTIHPDEHLIKKNHQATLFVRIS